MGIWLTLTAGREGRKKPGKLMNRRLNSPTSTSKLNPSDAEALGSLGPVLLPRMFVRNRSNQRWKGLLRAPAGYSLPPGSNLHFNRVILTFTLLHAHMPASRSIGSSARVVQIDEKQGHGGQELAEQKVIKPSVNVIRIAFPCRVKSHPRTDRTCYEK